MNQLVISAADVKVQRLWVGTAACTVETTDAANAWCTATTSVRTTVVIYAQTINNFHLYQYIFYQYLVEFVVAKITVQIVGGPVIMLVDFVPNQDHRNKKCSDNSSVLVCDLVNYYK